MLNPKVRKIVSKITNQEEASQVLAYLLQEFSSDAAKHRLRRRAAEMAQRPEVIAQRTASNLLRSHAITKETFY